MDNAIVVFALANLGPHKADNLKQAYKNVYSMFETNVRADKHCAVHMPRVKELAVRLSLFRSLYIRDFYNKTERTTVETIKDIKDAKDEAINEIKNLKVEDHQ